MPIELMTQLIFAAGVAQLGVLVASALVPFRLNWGEQLRCLPLLHRQMYWVYGGYVVLSIVAFSLLSLFNARELAGGGPLARGLCGFIAVFWGVRFMLQGVFDVNEHLTLWWLKLGYVVLTMLFGGLTVLYGAVAFRVLA